jgi:hypothetical protein
VAALAWVAHGGVYGAIIEAGGALSVLGLFVWVWLRERRRGAEAPMRDENGPG